MVATVFSLVFLLVFMSSYGVILPESIKVFLPFSIPVTGGVLLMLSYLQSGSMLGSLEKVQRKSVPSLIKMMRKDRALNFSRMVIVAFSLYSILFPVSPFLWQPIPFFIWFVGLGVALDSLWFNQKKAHEYLDVSESLKRLQNEAKGRISSSFEPLRRSYDRISEVATLAIDQGRYGDADEALGTMQKVANAYVNSYKEKGDPLSDEDRERLGSAIGYFIGPFRSIFTDALDRGAESLAFRVVLSLGNLCHHIAKVDRDAASIPLHAIGAITQFAHEEDWDDVSVKAFLTLQELGRVLVEDERIPTNGTGDLFQMVVTHLHGLAEEAFKKNREISLDLLMDPFRMLKECFSDGKRGATHPESAAMIAALDRTLGEFEALELVLRRAPEMPNLEEVAAEELGESPQ